MGQKAGTKISKSNPRFTPVVSKIGVFGDRDGGFRYETPEPKPPATPPEPSPEQIAALNSWLERETSGLRTNRDTILNEKKELDTQFKELQEQVAGLGDLDRVKALVEKFSNDEELKLIEEGKIDEVLERRTENLRKGLEAERDAARKALDDKDEVLSRKTETISRLTIDSKVREIGLSMDPPMDVRATQDAIRAARELFVLDDEDKPVAQKDGLPMIGKDGKTPLGLEEWLKITFEEGSTLWWGASKGGGANGGGDGGADTGSDAEAVEKMSPRQKLGVGFQKDD